MKIILKLQRKESRALLILNREYGDTVVRLEVYMTITESFAKIKLPQISETTYEGIFGIGNIVEQNEKYIIIETSFVRMTNADSHNIAGIFCYINLNEQNKTYYYKVRIKIFCNSNEEILYIFNGKILFDTNFINYNFDEIQIQIKQKPYKVEINPPITCND